MVLCLRDQCDSVHGGGGCKLVHEFMYRSVGGYAGPVFSDDAHLCTCYVCIFIPSITFVFLLQVYLASQVHTHTALSYSALFSVSECLIFCLDGWTEGQSGRLPKCL